MSTARPAARRLLQSCLGVAPASVPRRTAPGACQHFHSSPRLAARKRFRSVSAAKMGLLKSEKQLEEFIEKKLPKPTREEMEEYKQSYTPAQRKALAVGRKAIDPSDLAIQGRLRVDPYTLPYIDDFSQIRPIIDKRPKTQPPPKPDVRFMEMDEFVADLIKFGQELELEAMRKRIESGLGRSEDQNASGMAKTLKELKDFIPEEYKEEANLPKHVKEQAAKDFYIYLQGVAQKGLEEVEEKALKDMDNAGRWEKEDELSDREGVPTDADIMRYFLQRSTLTDDNHQSNTALAPGLPRKVPGVAGLYKHAVDPADEGLDNEGVYQDLKRRTGMSVREILSMSVKILVQRHVHNQTRLGKVRSSSILAIAGNKNGWLGLGSAKSVEHSVAVRKAKMLAIRNMRPIPRYENRTIYGNVEVKIAGTIVQLFARPPGFGLRVSHRIFEMARAAGLHDLAAKLPRSRNPMNTVKAAYEALLSQPNPEEIARGRGKKLVDVRKVYYGGAVH